MPLIRKDPPAAGPAADRPTPELATLLHGSVDERWTAARALAGDPAGIGALAAALRAETEPRVREAIFTSLALTHSPDAVTAVLPQLRADDPALRTGALDALRAMPAAMAARLPELLADPDPDVRLLAADLARELDPAVATPLLAGLLDREPEANVCAAAVEVLAAIGDAGAIPALQRCAARFRGDAFLPFAIGIALRRLGAGQPPRP